MKKIFTLLVAAICYTMVFGQIISVTDGTLDDWNNVPAEYLFETKHAEGASMDGLKSVKVYVDKTYIHLLVEVNDQVVTDREWTPFHVYINSDNSAETGGFGDQWITADVDIMCETAIFAAGENNPYNPAVYKWWGEVGENGWLWTDPVFEGTFENGGGALIPEGSLPLGNSQMVDGIVEMQIAYIAIPMPFDANTFTIGFDIQQSWSAVGILPNAADAEDGSEVLAEKLTINIHPVNENAADFPITEIIDDITYELTTKEPYTATVIGVSSKNITTAHIPASVVYEERTYSVTSIGKKAFSGYSKLTSITIPNSVTSIGDYAFCNCSGLTSITIGNSVTSIGDLAFDGCYRLTSITIPNSVTSIGEWAFASCSSLTSVTIGNSVTSIGEWAFALCSSLTSVTIGNNVTSIGSSAFYYCRSLTSITIPNSVTSIGDDAFRYCYCLTSVTIPNSVTSIGKGAFFRCSGLTSITIGNSVTSIGYSAFYDCSGLTSVTCKAVNLPEMGEEVFGNAPTTAATLYVPEVSLELYQAAEQWKEFGTILPISQVENDLENISSDNGYGVMDNGKILRNGQLIIIRDGVEYNTLGQAL